MCLGAFAQEAASAMTAELPAVLLVRQHAERVLGLAEGKHGRVLVTVQGDGVITYSAAREASGQSRALGSSQAQLLAPVQQLANSYVATVQPQGSVHGVLLCTPVTTQQPKPLLDAEQQLPLPSKLHSLHVLHPAQPGSKSGPGVAAVVLADGTVAAADFQQLCIHAAASSTSPAAASPGPNQQRPSTHRLLSAACSSEVLAVAKQMQGQAAAVDLYGASRSSGGSSGVDSAAEQPQQPSLQLLHSCSIPAPSVGSKLVGVCASGSLLLVLWSCHTISVCRSSSSWTSPPGIRQLSAVTTLQLPPALAGVVAVAAAAGADHTTAADRSTSKRKQRAAATAATVSGVPDWTAAALSDQHVLLVAVSSDTAGTKVHYALLDSTYGTCLSAGSFTVGSGSLSGRLQLLPLSQHPFAPVALLVAGSVWLLPLQLPKADLAGLVANLGLGSAQAHAAAATAAPEGTQLSLTARHQLNLCAIAAAVSTRSSPAGMQQQGPCVLQQLDTPAAAVSVAAAGSAMKAAVQQVQQVLDKQTQPAQEFESAVTQLCDSLQQQQQQQGATSVLASQQLLARALTALCEAQQWALLERLHSLAPLQSLAACADLVPSLAAAQQFSSMRAVLLSALEVPAEAVVKAVQQVLQQPAAQQQGAEGPSEVQQAAAQQIRAAAEAVVQQAEAAAAAGHADAAEQLVKAARHAAVAVDGFTSRELLLHVLLAVQVDGVEAQAALRALPTAAVLRLLRYMVKWLHKCGRNNLTTPSSDPLLLTPSEPQLMEWCKLLLDAQLTKLMMMPAAAPLLQQLQHLLRSQAAAISKLLALKGVTDTWATGAPLPAAAVAANSQYVLELLDLRVKPRAAAGAKAQ